MNMCVSGGKKCQFSGKIGVRTKWMIPKGFLRILKKETSGIKWINAGNITSPLYGINKPKLFKLFGNISLNPNNNKLLLYEIVLNF